jgi:micrococcal nuclease
MSAGLTKPTCNAATSSPPARIYPARHRPRCQVGISLISFIIFFTIPTAQAAEKQAVFVQEVITGDTLRLEGGNTLKYIGLQAPPLQSRIPLIREYGSEALEFNKKIVGGKKVLIEWGSQIRDNQRDLLGYVYLEDGTFVNQEILRAGHAKVKIIPPNIKHAAAFRKFELEARRNKSGLWKKEPENPFLKSEYIGEKNTKIYYLPNSPELDRIPQAGLVTFQSRVQAKAAGYRACFTCSESAESEF